jgi:hypothetical protein
MAKTETGAKKQSRVELENLTQRDRDILSLGTKEVMEKYQLEEKQAVYDRRFALKKKIKEAGLTAEQLVNETGKVEAPKRGRPKKVPVNTTEAPERKPVVEEIQFHEEAAQVSEKPTPSFAKPIELKFDGFSIKLNAVPRMVSLNPDTNAIEIDL